MPRAFDEKIVKGKFHDQGCHGQPDEPRRTHAQKRLDAIEEQACWFAVRLNILILREGDSAGRLKRLLAVSEQADRRAERRHKASLKP